MLVMASTACVGRIAVARIGRIAQRSSSALSSTWGRSSYSQRESSFTPVVTSYPRFMTSSVLKDNYEHVIVETVSKGDNAGVGIITLNRPKSLNALCDALFEVYRKI